MIRILLLICYLAVCPSLVAQATLESLLLLNRQAGGGGGGSVTFDGEAIKTGTSTASTTLTITSKTTAGANRCGIVCIASTIETTVVSGVDWGGSPMTEVDNEIETVGASLYSGMWRIVNPPTGSSTITITFTGSTTAGAAAVSFNGVNQTTPIVNKNKTHTSGATASPATINNTTATGEMVVDALAFTQFDTLVPSVGANQTTVENQIYGSFYFGLASYQAGADGGTMSWTYTGSAHWAIVSASLQP